jgi:hypothetical protein
MSHDGSRRENQWKKDYLGSQQGQKGVNTPEEAADIYLKGDLHLPGDLDSWKVE